MIAVAFFDKKIKGSVEFEENGKEVVITVQLEGFKKNSVHGFHIHEAGDLSEDCMSACAHFNPYGKNHGDIRSKERHVGDLGNVVADDRGVVRMQMTDSVIKLRGVKANIIGRSVVIHEDPDDLGKGGHDDSLTTGHSGKRIACAVIGYSRKMFS
jgi:Cu-Zn family superoxide dismutase